MKKVFEVCLLVDGEVKEELKFEVSMEGLGEDDITAEYSARMFSRTLFGVYKKGVMEIVENVGKIVRMLD